MSELDRHVVVSLREASVDYVTGPLWARSQHRALRDVSLDIYAGETLGIVGESGSGKTTLARLCLGLVKPSTGSALFEGRPAHQALRRTPGRIQVVLQHPEWSLNPRLRVQTSVAEPLDIMGWRSRPERQAAVHVALEQVGIDPQIATRYPHELSGGQRQRIAIARALITKPDFIVFDEVVSALDVSVQAQTLNLIRDLQAERAFCALFVSHEIAVVRYLASRVAVMRSGELLELAPARRFYEQPDHPYSRELLEAAL